MTDQPCDEANRYARLGPEAQALVDDYDQIALAELLVKAHDDLACARQEAADWAAAESADAAAGSYAGSSEHAIAHPQPWLHIVFTSPDETTANTSALTLADHLAAEFPGVGMRITTNATEAEPLTHAEEARLAQSGIDTPGCDCGHDGMGVSWHGDDCPWRRGVLDGVTPTDPTLREQLHAAIESEMYEYRERTMFWPEGGVTEEIARLATRGAMEVLDGQATPAWTPPPPGSTAEQLPEALLALIRDHLPDYTSTACQTADTLACTACYPGSGVPRPQYDEIREQAEHLHSRCRLNNKFTGQLCACGCHPTTEEQQPYPPIGLTNQENQP